MEPYVHDAVLDMQHARDELLAALAEVPPTGWERKVPYGGRTLHELLAHLAGADQAWAVAAQGLLRGEAETRAASREEAVAARERAIARGRKRPVDELLAETESRRRLLLGLYELLEKRHLALALPAYGDEHNSVRERIWRGWHDRRHAADVRRALRMTWEPPALVFAEGVGEAAMRLSPDETLYVIYSVDPSRWEMPSVVPDWSNRALLAHIATGDWVLQLHLESLIEGGAVAAWPDVAAGNAERIEERRFTPVATLIEEFLSTRHATMLLLAQLTRRDLGERIEQAWKPPPGNETVLDYLRDFWWHEKAHREQLRPAMKWAVSQR